MFIAAFSVCALALGCMEPPEFPSEQAVRAQFPLAVPTQDLQCLSTPAHGSFWDDCFAESGYFEVSVDLPTSSSWFNVQLHDSEEGIGIALFGMHRGGIGPEPNAASGSGFTFMLPFPWAGRTSYACKVYDTTDVCDLVACNWAIETGEPVPQLRGVGILPETGQAFCTVWQ